MEIQKLTRCDTEALRKLGRKMSETVIMGSMKLWREYTKTMERANHGEEATRRIEEERERGENEELEEERKTREGRLTQRITGDEEADDEGQDEEVELEIEEQQQDESERK
jgi:hypothetical protein